MVASRTSPYSAPVAVRPGGPLAAGTVIGERYQLNELIGRGGYGAVYRAYDSLLRTGVALKVLAHGPSPGVDLTRMAREVRLARSVRHPNVCAVYDLVSNGELWFITMDLARGTLVDELHDSKAPEPSWEQRERDALDVCAGLAAIHAAEIAHRDLKPSNVLRMPNGRLAIGDFGLALSTETRSMLPGGTPRYLAPEVEAGQSADQCSDVWQLGLVCHELLLRRRPQWLAGARGVPEPVVPTTGLPPRIAALVAVVARCLAWRRADRPASAVEVVEL